MVENGADLRTVQTILGHAEIDTTQRYVRVSQKHLREILARYHPRSKPRARMHLFEPASRAPALGRIIMDLADTGKTMCKRHLQLNNGRSKRSRDKGKQKQPASTAG
jgi:Phage integrase family